jgi:hypothetical protein
MAGIAWAADPGGALKDGVDCGGFAASDAATWLKVAPAQVTRTVQPSGKALWLCSFAVGKAPPAIAFSLEIAANAKKAAGQMERYRDDLATAGGTKPWKGRLPKGAYSDIMGVGDEAVWTDINGAFTVRKGHVIVQVTLPKEKLDQVKLGQAVVAKF